MKSVLVELLAMLSYLVNAEIYCKFISVSFHHIENMTIITIFITWGSVFSRDHNLLKVWHGGAFF